jgi:hypothetical protein
MKKSKTRKLLTSAFLCLFIQNVSAQNNVGINTVTPAASAALHIADTTKGILIPRMTAAHKAAIASPATGLMIFQTDGTAGFYYYNGSAWVVLGGGTATTDASLLTSGTLADARLSSNVTLKGNTFNTANNLVNLNGSTQLPAVSGVNLTNLNASNLASGTVPVARLGSSGTPSATTFLRGDNTWATPAGGSGSTTLLMERSSDLTVVSTVSYASAVSVSLDAGKTYFIEAQLYGQRDAGASVNGSSSIRVTYTGSAAVKDGVELNGTGYIIGTTLSSTSFTADGSTYTVSTSPRNGIRCVVTTTTAGTLAFEVAKGSSPTSTADYVVRTGSWIKATPVN